MSLWHNNSLATAAAFVECLCVCTHITCVSSMSDAVYSYTCFTQTHTQHDNISTPSHQRYHNDEIYVLFLCRTYFTLFRVARTKHNDSGHNANADNDVLNKGCLVCDGVRLCTMWLLKLYFGSTMESESCRSEQRSSSRFVETASFSALRLGKAHSSSNAYCVFHRASICERIEWQYSVFSALTTDDRPNNNLRQEHYTLATFGNSQYSETRVSKKITQKPYVDLFNIVKTCHSSQLASCWPICEAHRGYDV